MVELYHRKSAKHYHSNGFVKFQINHYNNNKNFDKLMESVKQKVPKLCSSQETYDWSNKSIVDKKSINFPKQAIKNKFNKHINNII